MPYTIDPYQDNTSKHRLAGPNWTPRSYWPNHLRRRVDTVTLTTHIHTCTALTIITLLAILPLNFAPNSNHQQDPPRSVVVVNSTTMVLAPYTFTGPLDPTITPDAPKLRDKSVIVTGGANGMGESVVRHFVRYGAFVTFADVNDERGRVIETELNGQYGQRCTFVKCDVRSWAEQKVLFETAKSKSPRNSVDVVLANAGISRSSGDSLWDLDGWSDPDRTLPYLTFYSGRL